MTETVDDDAWWADGLEDEPCGMYGVRPSKHQGHGSFTCRACYVARWCPNCRYELRHGHECPDILTRVGHLLATKDFCAEHEIPWSEEDLE